MQRPMEGFIILSKFARGQRVGAAPKQQALQPGALGALQTLDTGTRFT